MRSAAVGESLRNLKLAALKSGYKKQEMEIDFAFNVQDLRRRFAWSSPDLRKLFNHLHRKLCLKADNNERFLIRELKSQEQPRRGTPGALSGVGVPS